MWSSIRSRTRSALTVVAVLLTMALVVAAILFAVQRVFPAQTHRFQSYDLEVTDVTPAPPWHPGQSLSLQWVPTDAEIGPDEPPNSVTCTFSLYGPYPTQEAARADSGPPPPGDVPLAASTPPLALSTAVGAPAPAPVTFALPDSLAPGYYLVVAANDLGGPGGGTTSGWVAEVAA